MSSADIASMARRLYECLICDLWPSNATCVDYGIVSSEHLGALQWAVRQDGVTAEQLAEANGHAEKLKALIGPMNPYRGVEFRTPWDELRTSTEEPEK